MFIEAYCILNIYFNKSNKDIISEEETIEKIKEYNNPIIPQGFTKVETNTASWELDENGIPRGWNKGLVIEDEIGNQFVWVPVNSTWYDNLLNGLSYKAPGVEERNLLKPIMKYSGFYVGRYEAGVPKEMQDTLNNIGTETNDVQGIPVSKKGVRPWNYITKENTKINSEKMYSNEFVYSGLLTCGQWYLINSWLEESGYNVKDPKDYGNFSNVNFMFSGMYSDDLGVMYKNGNNKNKATKNMILATGVTDRNMTNNLYDFYGNVSESTISQIRGKSPDGMSERVTLSFDSQGGYYDNSSIAANQSFSHAWANSKTGFRVVLYVK